MRLGSQVLPFAAGFGYLMAIMQLPAKATQLFLHMTDNKYAMLMLINVLLLLLGTFMDMAPMILICTPIMLPVMKTLGVDPVHFGMIMLLNLGIGAEAERLLRLARRRAVELEVRAAHARGLHLDHYFARAGRGIGEVANFDLSVAEKDRTAHAAIL